MHIKTKQKQKCVQIENGAHNNLKIFVWKR